MPRRAEAVLAYIATHPGVTDEELVRALHLPSRAAVAAVCRRLEGDGRIERRKEGRIVRNHSAPSPRPEALAPAQIVRVPEERGLDAGVLVEVARIRPPAFLRRPGALVLRVDVPPRHDSPGALAAASLAFDGERLSVHLRAATDRMAGFLDMASTFDRLQVEGGVTLRFLRGPTARGVLPEPPPESRGPLNRSVRAGGLALLRWWAVEERPS